jgi:hypothetical protein
VTIAAENFRLFAPPPIILSSNGFTISIPERREMASVQLDAATSGLADAIIASGLVRGANLAVRPPPTAASHASDVPIKNA